MKPRQDWVIPQSDDPVTAKNMAEMRKGHDEWEEFVARGCRILTYWKREVMDKRPAKLKIVRSANANSTNS